MDHTLQPRWTWVTRTSATHPSVLRRWRAVTATDPRRCRPQWTGGAGWGPRGAPRWKAGSRTARRRSHSPPSPGQAAVTTMICGRQQFVYFTRKSVVFYFFHTCGQNRIVDSTCKQGFTVWTMDLPLRATRCLHWLPGRPIIEVVRLNWAGVPLVANRPESRVRVVVVV